MRSLCFLVVLLAMPSLGQTPSKQSKKTFRSQVVTGCLDEKPGVYVLRSDDVLKEVAQLDPVGFEKQIFARYVGHKVAITGELMGSTEPPTLRVLSPSHIKDISEMCTPVTEK